MLKKKKKTLLFRARRRVVAIATERGVELINSGLQGSLAVGRSIAAF